LDKTARVEATYLSVALPEIWGLTPSGHPLVP